MRNSYWGLGGRVFVRVDWRGNEVGAAGTIVGLRLDGGAWVRLDHRPPDTRAHFLFHENDPRGNDLIAHPAGCIVCCPCGTPVVGAGFHQGQACWCSECQAFVEAIIQPTAQPRYQTRLLLPEAGVDLFAMLDQIHRSLVEQALTRSRGNKAKAARLLGLNRTTLVEQMKRFASDRSAA